MFNLEDDMNGGGGRGGGGTVKETKKVGDLPARLSLVQTDVFAVKQHIGPAADPYQTLFVEVKNGDYAEVWGVKQSVPYNDATAYRIR